MPPPLIPILAQSENKSKFLERLGISDQTEEGRRLYSIMKVRFQGMTWLTILTRPTRRRPLPDGPE